MQPAGKKPTAANPRSWRVIIIRSKGEYLGSVEAPNREGAVRQPPELTGHGLPLSKCEAYNRVYDQFYQSC
jgi:hypothetical protein